MVYNLMKAFYSSSERLTINWKFTSSTQDLHTLVGFLVDDVIVTRNCEDNQAKCDELFEMIVLAEI